MFRLWYFLLLFCFVAVAETKLPPAITMPIPIAELKDFSTYPVDLSILFP